MLLSRIKAVAKPGITIPKPYSKGKYIVERWGISREEEALVYSIPKRPATKSQSMKRIRGSDFQAAYKVLNETGLFKSTWFDKYLPQCAKDGRCNFTTIGGIFELIGDAKYIQKGVYKKTINNEIMIDKYTRAFESQLLMIDGLKDDLTRKIIYLVAIDSFSKAAFSKIKRSRERFITFIDECSNWDDKDRVSIPLLRYRFEDVNMNSGHLYKRAFHWFTIRRKAENPKSDSDPWFNQVVKLANSNEKFHVEKTQYKELLWAYRNSLVHEFKVPGKSMDIWGWETPYYVDVINGNWQLVYSVNFISWLCHSCLRGVKNYLITRNINPYDGYRFMDLWY